VVAVVVVLVMLMLGKYCSCCVWFFVPTRISFTLMLRWSVMMSELSISTFNERLYFRATVMATFPIVRKNCDPAVSYVLDFKIAVHVYHKCIQKHGGKKSTNIPLVLHF